MPIRAKHGEHMQVTCDGCQGRYPTLAEVCCKRLMGNEAKTAAADKFMRAGWHVDGAGTPRERWYCPKCRSVPHL
jgi:hypothetical protein